MTALCSAEMWDGDKRIPRLPWDRTVAIDGPGRPLKVRYGAAVSLMSHGQCFSLSCSLAPPLRPRSGLVLIL